MAPANSAAHQMYSKDEKVLCFHLDLLYEAKVLAVVPNESDKRAPPEYLIHYRGWKTTWDQTVPEERLRKYTPENIEMAQNLRRDLEMMRDVGKPKMALKTKKGGAGGSARSSEERTGAGIGGPRGQKRTRDNDTEKEEHFHSRPSIRLPVPDTLKSYLVDDWENITKNLQLVSLPSKTPVNNVLSAYAEQEKSKRRPGSADMDILEEVVQGMREYFKRSLGKLLLYRFEREQYYVWNKKLTATKGEWEGKDVGDVYGPEHLCRLFGT
jgi:mortality factor 4-like protein 1